MRDKYLSNLENAITDFAQTLSYFNDQHVNLESFDGRWTAAQVADHVLKSLQNVPGVLGGNSSAPGRDELKNVEIIRSVFLNYENKMQSPEFILPSEIPLDKKLLIGALHEANKSIKEIVQSIDLSNSFTDFQFPGIGALTGYEWLCFAECHTIRHTRQLKNIYAIVNKYVASD
jgi:hypothetical protein